MKYTKEVVKPATTETRTIKVECDLCKNEIKRGWYAVSEVIIQYEHGTSYPEGGSSEIDKIDMCPECFKNKLLPWLESLGVKPRVEEIDW